MTRYIQPWEWQYYGAVAEARRTARTYRGRAAPCGYCRRHPSHRRLHRGPHAGCQTCWIGDACHDGCQDAHVALARDDE